MKVKLNLPNHVIAEQMGWSERSVEKMIATYGHTSIGALEAIDAASPQSQPSRRQSVVRYTSGPEPVRPILIPSS